ncbi:unannotated protein [freshwater metagenome]|uniref:Unannotated protein n=1 Tax=freshwater metagenome TaxID=449393 RepID=A0A6J7I370_9ZZZZ
MDAAGCPAHAGFTMMDPEFLADPYAVFQGLRDDPVFYAPDLDVYVVTRYAEVDAVLTRPEDFSSSVTLTPVTPPGPEALEILAAVDFYRPPNLINADAPRHTKVRRYVQEAMSPRRLRALEPVVTDWAGGRIDEMVARGHGDVFADLAFPLPALTGFSLLGFPAEDIELLKSWCANRVAFTYGRAAPDEQVRIATSVANFWRYTNDFVAQRIAEPVDDLASDLARRHLEEPEEFTPRDVATVLFEMAVASHETTTNALTNGLRRLLEHRDQWEALVADPSRITNAVEECLRFDGSVMGWRRRATRDVELAGVTIPADATVLILLASANHDPERFERPEAFDVCRKEARSHMTFGKGVHFCQGAPLARMELRVVLELLTARAPDMRIVPGQHYSFTPNITMRGLNQLLVEFPAAAAA